jgi:hypothetical protein
MHCTFRVYVSSSIVGAEAVLFESCGFLRRLNKSEKIYHNCTLCVHSINRFVLWIW